MEEEKQKDYESDIDIYCDLDDTCAANGKLEESSPKANGVNVQDISTLFSENECKISFSCEDGKKTKMKISKQPENSRDIASYQALLEKEFDLLSDVLNAEVTEKIAKVEKKKLELETLIAENIELKKLNSDLGAEVFVLRKKNLTLQKNICALYKTAKEEIARKDALIFDLREKNDGLIFRRSRLLANGRVATRQFSKDQGHDGVQAADIEGPNARCNELKENNGSATTTKACANYQVPVEDGSNANVSGFVSGGKMPAYRPSAEASSLENGRRCVSEKKEKKLPKAFQDPGKRSHRRHSRHKSQKKHKRCRRSSSDEMSSDSDKSGNLTSSNDMFCSSSSENEANKVFQKTLRKLKNSRPRERRYRKPVLSEEELCRIYCDYQRSLPNSKKNSMNENAEKGKLDVTSSKTDNSSKHHKNSDSETTVAKNNFLQKLLSYEKQESVQELERTQRNNELNRIITSASGAEDFSQLYCRYIANWALTSLRPPAKTKSQRMTSHCEDSYHSSLKPGSGEESVSEDCDDNECDDFFDKDDYDAQGNYHKFSKSSYVDLDQPHDEFYSAPRKSFYDHLMEEKARQACTYFQQGNQANNLRENSINMDRQYGMVKIVTPEKIPPSLKGDSLKLFSYQGKTVPVAVKKKILGYAKTPTKVPVVPKNTNKKVTSTLTAPKLKAVSSNIEKTS